MKVFWRCLATVSCALWLTACGGGGGGDSGAGTGGGSGPATGGGSGTGTGGGANGSALAVTSDRTSLDFVGFVNAPAQPQNVIFTLVNAPAGATYYGQVVLDRPSDFTASFNPTGSTTGMMTVFPMSGSAVSRSGTILVRLCNDPNCSSVAWSQTLPYRYAIFSIDGAALALSGAEGSESAAASVAITPADTGNFLKISASTYTGDGWLSATRNAAGDGISVKATAAALKSGTYTGMVKVQIAGTEYTPPVVIPVGYTVGLGFVAPVASALELKVDSQKITGSTAVAFNGGSGRSWTASSDQPWLVLDTPSGTGAGTLSYHVDTSLLAGMDNWTSATAQVTLRAAGLSDARLAVTLDKHLPEVYVTSPATLVAGRAGTVRVIGRGLSQLADLGRIRIPGASGFTGTVLSDREALLNIPAMAGGRTSVSVVNALGLPSASGTLGAASLASVPAGFVANPGEKRSAVFDPTRNALYAINWTQKALVRYRYAGGQWQVDGLPVASIGDMAMSPDRKTLYVASGSRTLQAVDPDTLQITATYTTDNAFNGSLLPSRDLFRGLPVTSNLRLWFVNNQWSGLYYFDMKNGRFGSQPLTYATELLYSPGLFASGDGTRMYISSSDTRASVYQYAAESDSVTALASAPGAYRALYDETGSRLLVEDERVYRGDDTRLVGRASVTGGLGMGSVISPDGTRVYRQVSAGMNSLTVDHINVYDTTRVQPGTSELVKLGEIPVASRPVRCDSNSNDACVTTTFLISPMGDTLFWLGDQGLVVIPVPATMSGIQTADARFQKAAER